MSVLSFLALSFQCFLGHLEWASSVEITKPFSLELVSKPAKTKNLTVLLKSVWNEGNPDTRYFAISWVESRLRVFPELGNNGRACGTFQIHAHQSAPSFKVGWNKWYKLIDKAELPLTKEECDSLKKEGSIKDPVKRATCAIIKTHTLTKGECDALYKQGVIKDPALRSACGSIAQECVDLQKVDYSVKVMAKYLALYDQKGLNLCHHQCGIYGKCKPWYKQRADFWNSYFTLAKLVCDEEKAHEIMSFMKTGTPSPSAPAELIQGYLDGYAGRPATSDSDTYMAGYRLASEVKAGTKPAPVWAPPA